VRCITGAREGATCKESVHESQEMPAGCCSVLRPGNSSQCRRNEAVLRLAVSEDTHEGEGAHIGALARIIELQ